MVKYITLPPEHEGFRAARYMAANSGCVKAPVGAAIFDADMGLLGAGNNDVLFTHRHCPRVIDGYRTGEGYELCKSMCRQSLHAEAAAILHAKKCAPPSVIEGATLFLWGHVYCCDSCVAMLEEAGITTVALPEDPDTGLNPSFNWE